MNRFGRRFLLAAGAAALARPAFAQGGGFPDRPLRIVVPHGPGGASDTWGRLIASRCARSSASPC